MIPVNEPLLTGREEEYVVDCVRTGWVSSAGKYIDQFETAWAAYCGMAHGIAVSNGTTALQTAIGCLNLQPGDEVIVPTFTIISCASEVIHNGARPVLVDADPRTWCMDVGQVEQRVTPRTRAIMPVHIYGHPVDMDALQAIARRHSLAIVEDAAEAHGAECLMNRSSANPVWKRCGGLGDLSTFSFYANKLVTTGEGGMVLTSNAEQAAHAVSLRNLCFRNDRRFYHTELGYNHRLTNMQAALGLAQVERMDEIVARKRRMGAMYTERLQGIPGLQLPVEEPWAKNVYWMYGIVVDEATGMDAVEFAKRLGARGVQTRPFFLGMHEQPVFHERGLFKGERYPVAERLARQGLYVPSGVALTDEQLDQVADVVRAVLTN